MTHDDGQTHDEPTPPRDETATRDGEAPRDGDATRDTVPSREGVSSHDDVTPHEDVASSEGVAPSEDVASSGEVAPSEGVMPHEEVAPREEVAARSSEGVAAREEVAARPVPAPAPSTAEPGDALRLQPRLMPRSDGLYYVSEILAYHDEAFVEAAFASVLRRPPAADEFRHTLADLRNGAREKIDILRDLARTAEGKSLAAFDRIAGLRQSRLVKFARGLPIVGDLWRILAAVVRLPVALRHQRQFEAYALAQHQRIADHINAQRWERIEAFERVAAELRLAVADASDAVSLLSDALAETSARHAGQQSQLARRLDEAARRLEDAERLLAGQDARLEEHGRQLEARVEARLDARLDARLHAQQEYLVREQQAIVEAQKAALANAEEGLRAAVAAARESVGGKV